MQKKLPKIGRRTAALWGAMGALLAGFAVLCVQLDMETRIGFFANGSVFAVLYKVLLTFASLASVIWLLFPIAVCETARTSDIWERAVAVFASLASVVLLVYGISDAETLLARIAFVFLLPSALYFALQALGQLPALRIFLSLSPACFAVLYLLVLYFDMSLAIGSDVRILEQLALIAALFSMLTEIRTHIGKERVAFSLTANALMTMLTFPWAVAALSLAGDLSSMKTMFGLFLLCYVLYADIRTYRRWFSLPELDASLEEEPHE